MKLLVCSIEEKVHQKNDLQISAMSRAVKPLSTCRYMASTAESLSTSYIRRRSATCHSSHDKSPADRRGSGREQRTQSLVSLSKLAPAMATTTRWQERNGSTTSQLLQGEDEVRKFVAALVSYTYSTANPCGSGHYLWKLQIFLLRMYGFGR